MGWFGTTAATLAGGIGRGASAASSALGRAGAGLGFTAPGRMLMAAGPYGRAALGGGALGAGVGGISGALSDDGSMIGGAFKGALAGAGLGVGVRGGMAAGRAGMGMYNIARGMGAGRGKAAYLAFDGLGRGSGALIGRTANRTYNYIQGLFSVKNMA